MFKFSEQMLSRILTIDDIKKLGNRTIVIIKNLGLENYHRLCLAGQNHDERSLSDSHYTIKRAIELSNSKIAYGLSDDEKQLFISEARFIDDSKIVNVLQEHDISVNDILEFNSQIVKFQKADEKYNLSLTKLEKKYDITYAQVVKIINELYPQLLKLDYTFNIEDKKLYSTANQFALMVATLNIKRKKDLTEINNNQFLIKIANICKNYYNIDPEYLYIFINKVNQILVTDHEICNQLSTKQKKLTTKKV